MRSWLMICVAALGLAGCGEPKSPPPAGSAGPSLDAASPEERAAAAREAAKKYGAEP